MMRRSPMGFHASLHKLTLIVCTLGLHLALPTTAQVVLDGTIGDVEMGQDVLPGIDNLGQDATYLIHDGLGEQSGNNLYFSFDQFSVGSGEIATFMSASPVPIDLVMSRVTGGSLSQINGMLRSTIPGADLFLINPAGVAFGAGSSLDVPRSLHITTADYLRHTDGSQFLVTATIPSALSTAPIDAFGFWDAEVGTITVQDTRLELRTGQTLSLVGGDIEVLGYPEGAEPDFENRYSAIRVPSGRVNLAAVASAGEVVFDDSRSAPILNVDSFDTLGNIRFAEQASLTVNGDPGGTVVVRGHDLEVSDDGYDVIAYEAFEFADHPAARISIASVTEGEVDHPGAGLDIDLLGDLVLENASLTSWTLGSGRGGDIRIRADSVSVSGPALFSYGADIGINSFTALGAGDAGDLELEADHIDLFGRLLVGSRTFFGGGNAGDITVIVRALTANGGLSGSDPLGATRPISALSTVTTNGSSGRAGNVMIHADEIHLIDHGHIASASVLGATGDAGSITIDTRQLEIRNAYVRAFTLGSGDGGSIDVTADQIVITADPAEVTERGGINAGTFGSGEDAGDGGSINITTNQLKITENSFVTAGTSGTGAGGSISITADQLEITEGGGVYAVTYGSGEDAGDAGSISIAADQLEITEGGSVSASTYGSGSGGSIDINASQIDIIGRSDPDPSVSRLSGIAAETYGSGAGGTIEITADRLTMRDRGVIISGCLAAECIGTAGDIMITADEIALLDDGYIFSGTYGAGSGGDVTIRAGSLQVSGFLDNPDQVLPPGIPIFSRSQISTSTLGSGDAGDIAVFADQVRVLDGGSINSATLGSGAGGEVTITSDDVVVSGVNSDHQSFVTGYLGDPDLALELSRSTINAVSATAEIFPGFILTATGDAGSVTIRGGANSELRVDDGGSITSATNNVGAGGSVDIDVARVTVRDGGSIVARSESVNESAGDAGGITIQTQDLRMEDGTVSVRSEASDAGNIEIVADNGISLFGSGSTIEANVGGGAGTSGGNITLSSDWVVIDGDSSVIAQAVGGQGGNIEINTQGLFAYPGAVIDASSEFGLSGTVQVNAPDTNLTSALATLSDSYQDEIALARNQCALEGAEERGSFVLGGYAGIPEAPDAPLPGFSLGGRRAVQ